MTPAPEYTAPTGGGSIEADPEIESDRNELLDAFQRAKDLNLCPNRLWAVAGEGLPNVFPDCELTPLVGDTVQEHEECTAGFCEYSLRDFTAVEQRHECKSAEGVIAQGCTQIQYRFPSALRDRAALEGKSTAWHLSGNTLLEHPRPYMAISHVWADGTGTGAWQAGTVNECLYGFFENIARHFSCEGIWWDTLCIPREKAARALAIMKIEKSYEDAQITLVHDCFLRNWEWDVRTACFAIIMSPWFSRGWTALELKKSQKIKVIFKGPSGPVIKDLDEEILAQADEPDGPRKAASSIIQNLRKDSSALKLNDLLTILRSRYTSWPKDMAVISALLVGVAPERSQQKTYRKILRKFGSISPGQLFHFNVTMSSGFTWCPTSLFDMPPDPGNASLTLSADGNLEGKWWVLPADQCADLEERCWWGNMHHLVKSAVQNALRRNWRCQLLAECGKVPVTRALLVRETKTSDFYEYISALSFRQEFSEVESMWVEKSVIISGYRLQDEPHNPDGSFKLTRNPTKGFDSKNILKDFTRDDTSDAHLLHTAIWRREYEPFLALIQKTDLSITDALGKGPLHLAAERGHPRMVQDLALRVDLNLQCSKGQTALHSAAWGGSTAVVTALLQTDIDRAIRDNSQNLALHIAARFGHLEIFKLLLQADNVDIKGQNDLTPLHFATIYGHAEIVSLLGAADLEARDATFGWTPLHTAVDSGNIEIVKLLIQRGADVNAVDHHAWWTPLHIAMINGHTEVTRLLLNRCAVMSCDKCGWMPHYFAEANGHTEILHLLTSQSTHLSSANNVQWMPMHCRAINKQPGLSRLLAEDGVEVYLQPRPEDWSEMHFAAKHNLHSTIEFLLQREDYLSPSGRIELLHDASRHGYEVLMRYLINEGIDLESRSPHDLTPLHIASQGGHETIVRMLLDAQANPNAKHAYSSLRPLHIAALEGHVKVIELLLEAGAEKDAKGFSGVTPIHLATVAGREDCVRALLKANANITVKGSPLVPSAAGSTTPLHTAINLDHEAIAKILIGVMGHIDSPVDGYGTILQLAVDLENVVITKYLLQAGANPNAGPGKKSYAKGARPLHFAALAGNEVIMQLLLDAGADIMGRDVAGRTALHYVCGISTNGGAIPFLLNAGAEINAKDEKGFTALHCACYCEDDTDLPRSVTLQGLLQAGPDLEVRDDHGATALHYAARYAVENGVLTQLLLDAGANTEARDSDHQTPLFLATGDSISLLASAGADLEARDARERTPLMHAAKKRSAPDVTKFLEAGASVNAKDYQGKKALSMVDVTGPDDWLVWKLLDSASLSTRVKRLFGVKWDSGILVDFRPNRDDTVDPANDSDNEAITDDLVQNYRNILQRVRPDGHIDHVPGHDSDDDIDHHLHSPPKQGPGDKDDTDNEINSHCMEDDMDDQSDYDWLYDQNSDSGMRSRLSRFFKRGHARGSDDDNSDDDVAYEDGNSDEDAAGEDGNSSYLSAERGNRISRLFKPGRLNRRKQDFD